MNKLLILLFFSIFNLMSCDEKLIQKPQIGVFTFTDSAIDSSLSYLGPLIELFLDDNIKVVSLIFELHPNSFTYSRAFGLAKSICALKSLYKKPVIAYAEETLYDSAYVIAISADYVMTAPLCGLGHLGYSEIYVDKSEKLAAEGVIETPIKAGKYKYLKDPNFKFTEEDLSILRASVEENWQIIVQELLTLRPSLSDHKETWINGEIFGAKRSNAVENSFIDKMGDKFDLTDFALQLLKQNVNEESHPTEKFLTLKNPYSSLFVSIAINTHQESKIVILAINDTLKWQHSTHYFKLLSEAFEDPKTLGIILHISSSGANSASMLYNLFTQIKKLKQMYGKPLVTYIEYVAFSGGYWLACCADFIIASPSSSIGSIGVRMSKTDCTQKDLKNQNVYHVISSNKFATIFNEHSSSNEPLERMLQEQIDSHHAGFIEQVKDARPKCRDNENDWKEAQLLTSGGALKVGLIDAVGCMIDAIQRISKDIKLQDIHFVFQKLTKDVKD